MRRKQMIDIAILRPARRIAGAATRILV